MYVVLMNGTHSFNCASEQEVWDVIGRHPFGSLYEVSSTAGEDVSQFIPF